MNRHCLLFNLNLSIRENRSSEREIFSLQLNRWMLVFVVDWLIEVFVILRSKKLLNKQERKVKKRTFSFMAESYIWRQRFKPISCSCNRLVVDDDTASTGVNASDTRSTGDEDMLVINDIKKQSSIDRFPRLPSTDLSTFIYQNFNLIEFHH